MRSFASIYIRQELPTPLPSYTYAYLDREDCLVWTAPIPSFWKDTDYVHIELFSGTFMKAVWPSCVTGHTLAKWKTFTQRNPEFHIVEQSKGYRTGTGEWSMYVCGNIFVVTMCRSPDFYNQAPRRNPIIRRSTTKDFRRYNEIIMSYQEDMPECPTTNEPPQALIELLSPVEDIVIE